MLWLALYMTSRHDFMRINRIWHFSLFLLPNVFIENGSYLAMPALSWIKWERSTNFHLPTMFQLWFEFQCSFWNLLILLLLSFLVVMQSELHSVFWLLMLMLVLKLLYCLLQIDYFIPIFQTIFLSCSANLRVCGLIYIQHGWNVIAKASNNANTRHIFT